MSVNFTGIKNVGAMYIAMPEINHKMDIMSMQLTNDESGNDLDEFKTAIEKTGNPERYILPYEGAVNISVSTIAPEEEYVSPERKFFLNGKQLKVNDRNLPVFSYLCKLTNKIKNKDPKEMGASVDYVQTPDFLGGSSIGYYMKQIFINNPQANLFPILNNIYKPTVAKAGAEIINDSISDTMADYFA